MLSAVICCWLWVCAQGHEHEHPPVVADNFTAHSPVDVRYDLHARLVPDSGYITGMLDATLCNGSGETIGEFFIACDTALRIDSVLYQGVPIEAKTASETSDILRVVPPQVLSAGETTHLLFSFRTPLSVRSGYARGLEVLENWFPQLLRPGGASDVSHGHPIAALDNRFRSDIRATLEIDSAYSLVVAGELLNEKEHIGLVRAPEPGEVQIDIVGTHQTLLGGVNYRPSSPSGNKRYYVRHLNADGLPLVIGRDFVQDRAAVDGLTLNLFRSPTVNDALARDVLSESRRLAEVLTLWLGAPDYPVCNVVVGTDDETHLLDPSLPVLARPGSIGKVAVLEVVAALIELWLDRQSDGSMGGDEVQLLKCYITATLLAGSTLYSRHLGSEILESGPLSSLQVTNRMCGLHAASFVVGHEVFWSVIRNWLAELPGEHSHITGLDSALDESLAHVCDDLSLAVLGSGPFDFGAEAASPSSWRLYNHGDLALPLEIAYIIGHGDTLIDTILVRETQTPHGGQDISLPHGRSIRTIIVDPYYRYNDVNRRDNVLHLMPSRQRHFPPEDVFPLYNR